MPGGHAECDFFNTVLQKHLSLPNAVDADARPASARIQRYFFNLITGVPVFISNAYAQSAGSAGPTGLLDGLLAGPMPIFIAMFVVMYFLMIRPQQKKAKEQKAMMDALGKGDEVVLAGGILGKVTKVNDTYVTVEVANNTEIVVQKNSIVTLLPKGTLKAL